MTDTIVRDDSTVATPATPRGSTGTAVLFTVTALVGAGLLFVVQPMIARLVLPSYGGSATVWSTSSLFFQVLLLLGYVYTHAATRRLGPRWQPPLHVLVLLAPLAVLPIALPGNASPSADASPVLWLVKVLAVMIGLPFLVVSTTGPLLQRWYSWTGGHRADDPYFLFAASNLGSFGGLLAYPLLVEPLLTLEQQRTWWSWGFGLFVLLTATCGLVTWATAGRQAVVTPPMTPVSAGSGPAAGWRQIGRWTLLAFLPSGMMLAVTSHVTTDIAPIPLLWVVPLAIYLGTFVIAFARTSRAVPVIVVRLAVAATFVAAASTLMQARTPILVDVALNMVMLALVAFAAHARLSAERPDVEHLTTFYLVIAAGGALGGLLNGIVAPVIFDRVLEYPLLAVLVPLALVGRQPRRAAAVQAVSSPLLTRVAVVGAALALALGVGAVLSRWADTVAMFIAGLALASLAGFLLSTRRALVAVFIALMFITVSVYNDKGTFEHVRTFYGSYRVFNADGRHQFAHGKTLHGTQWLGARRDEPTTYYTRSGPLGDVFSVDGIHDVGVVGLGVGTIAAYGETGQNFDFIEIDPEVVRIARDRSLFTYLADSKATISTTIGDGRLEVAKLPKDSLDMLVLDAFSSDAIPVHLLTTQAMRTYAERLRPGGVLVVHISNRAFDLAPVLTGAARSLGWSGRVAMKGGEEEGGTLSRWVVLTSDASRLDDFKPQDGWNPLPRRAITWTDDYSSILPVLN